MFQNLKKKTRNREDISKLLIRLLYKIGFLEKKVEELEEDGSGIQSIQEGDNINVDNTDPLNPIISSEGINLEGYTETGSREGGDLVVKLGDYDDSGNGNKITIDDASDEIVIKTGGFNVISPGFTFSKYNGDGHIITTDSDSAGKTATLPNKSGTIAFTDDIEIFEAPEDGTIYGRQNAAWVEVIGGNTPTLQEVTDEGATTSNNLVVTSGSQSLTLTTSKISSIDLAGGFNLEGTFLGLGRRGASSFDITYGTESISAYGIGAKGTYLFPDLGYFGTEETLATQEWVGTQLSSESPLTTTVEISSAELLALATTPVELIPAPGDGKYIILDNVVSVYEYGTEEYDFDQPVDINLDAFSAISFDLSSLSNNVTVQNVSYYTVSENQALMLESSTAPTQGDGTLKLILTYRIITI